MSMMGTSSVFSQYKKIAAMTGADKKVQAPAFNELLAQSLKEASHAVKANEHMAKQQVVDQVDLTKLTTDTAKLDVMISTVTALRDKVINAIQELQKMPI
ncbi:flagellar hook-basal body complex protein FliE [Candidatus Odyssella thessalonicensis]|uniref:flagellar hook-basal body complex protein FliE n=1 Tax=Candidatus Odyssella thessalonicensis TaxID=84647 RepID=UPI000225BB03|nr:flagellar hook-basal body complex protein FliE [Candidatus Odyssella thessalonicensis]